MTNKPQKLNEREQKLHDLFNRYHEECLQVVYDRNQDYTDEGSMDNITPMGVYGVAVRLMDKVYRLAVLSRPGAKAPRSERLRDVFVDISNYSVIGLALLDGEWSKLHGKNVRKDTHK